MNNHIFIALGVVAVFSISAYLVYSTANAPTEPPNGASETPTLPYEEPITASGTITCIPKIGDGPQTMECALGLQTDDGMYYGLRYLSDHDENFALVSPEITVEVSGNLVHEEMVGPDGNRYDTQGIIEIESITAITEAE